MCGSFNLCVVLLILLLETHKESLDYNNYYPKTNMSNVLLINFILSILDQRC